MLIQTTVTDEDAAKIKQLADEKRLSVSATARLLIFERLTQLDSINKKYIEE